MRQTMRKPFHGWWVLAALFICGFMVYGGGLYSFVLFIPPWTQEFGWSRATTAGLVSAFYFSAPFVLLGAQTAERFGAVRILTMGIMIEAVSVCLLSATTALWQMYALRILMGFGKVMFAVCVPIVLAIWFKKRLAFALAIAWAGWNLGGLVLGPVSSLILSSHGWRTTCLLIGVGLLVFAVLPPLRVLRIRSPAQLGLGRDGEPPATAAAATTESTSLAPDTPLWRCGTFWVLALATASFYSALAGMMTHQAALVETAGFSVRTAGIMVGSAAGIAAVAGPVFGWLLDRGYLLWVGSLMHLCLLGGVLSLAGLTRVPSVGILALYLATFGLTLGGADVFWVTLLRYRFPRFSVARTYSAWYFVEIATLGLAPIGVGRLFDSTGNYYWTMLVLLVPVVLSALCWIAARRDH